MTVDAAAHRYAVGIDLGTTHCVLSFAEPGDGDEGPRQGRDVLLVTELEHRNLQALHGPAVPVGAAQVLIGLGRVGDF